MQRVTAHAMMKDSSLIAHVMPQELVILDMLVESTIDIFRYKMAAEQIAAKTSRFSILIDHVKYKAVLQRFPEFFPAMKERGLSSIHFLSVIEIPEHRFVGVGNYSDEMMQAVGDFKQLRFENPGITIVPCLYAKPDQIHHLGPLISFLAEDGHRDVLLVPPKKRTRAAVAEFQKVFEYLRMRGVSQTWVSFFYFHVQTTVWNMQTYNSFAGPNTVHFDLSNRCTHSCTFCGLYSDTALKRLKEMPHKEKSEAMKMMRALLDYEKGRQTLETLPESVRHIQFGGAGDPMIHPNFVAFIRTARLRGISCEVLSNMDYLDDDSIKELTNLGSTTPDGLQFIANVSGVSPEMYLKTRPRQTKKNYDNVMSSLERLTEERIRAKGRGVHFTMMCVMNNVNYVEAEAYVRKSKSLGACRVYLKPMEIHIDYQESLLIADHQKKDYAKQLRSAIKTADKLGMTLMERVALLKTIEQSEGVRLGKKKAI